MSLFSKLFKKKEEKKEEIIVEQHPNIDPKHPNRKFIEESCKLCGQQIGFNKYSKSSNLWFCRKCYKTRQKEVLNGI